MPRREFELVSLDSHLLDIPVGATLGLDWGEFLARGQLSAQPGDLFALRDDLNDGVRRQIETLLEQSRGFCFGDLRLNDVYVTGPRGLIIDRNRRQILIGHCLGWTADSVAMDVEKLLDGKMTDHGTALLPDRVFDRPKSARHRPDRPRAWRTDPTRKQMPASHPVLELVMSPGFTIYGHWLIDVLPRLLRIEQDSRAPLLMPRPPGFTSQLLEPLGIETESRVTSYIGSVVYADELWVRTQTKFGQLLDRPSAQHTWGLLREALARTRAAHEETAGSTGLEPADRIYVSRARWSLGRSLLNHAEVEAHLSARGYLVLHPQDLSIAEQEGLFAGARHVIGEDGSGLHNIIYAREPMTVSVIDLARTNPFHASVANVMGHRVAHLAARQEGEGWVLPLEDLDRHLDDLDHPTIRS